MTSPQEKQLILDYALASEDNLAIALKIGMTLADLRARVISDFAAVLETQLQTKLGTAWAVVNSFPRGTALERLNSLATIYQEPWKDVAHVTLSLEGSGGYFLVTTIDGAAADAIDWVKVKATLDRDYGSGSTSRWNRWWRKTDRPYQNWYDEETMLRFWEKKEAAAYFADHLITIAGVFVKAIEDQRRPTAVPQ